MSILENAIQHFAAIQKAPRRVIEVPEWDAKFYIKTLNLAEACEIQQAREKSYKEGMVKTIALRCLDEAGNRVFFSHHEKMLCEQVCPNVLSEIVVKMVEPTREEIEKN